MSKDIEVIIREAENVCELARVEQGFVPDDHVAMALVRAANAACTQLGIESPGTLFAEVSGALRNAQDTNARAQLVTIDRTLEHLGYSGTGSFGVSQMVADLTAKARVGRALGDGFSEALAEARDAYDRAALTGRELNARERAGDQRPIEPERAEVFREAANALGHLLAEMRRINPRPERNGDGSTTITLTEPVEIGTPATAPEAVQ